MSQPRAEQVARAVAEALGVAYAPNKMDGVLDFWTEWPEYKNAERDAFQASSWVGPDKFLADMNTARRFLAAVEEKYYPKPDATSDVNMMQRSTWGRKFREFMIHAWSDCPAAIESLAVACWLVEPETEKQT